MKKFACGDDVFIAVGQVMVEENASGRTVTGPTIHLLSFDQCADHLRQEVCETLGADTEYLSSNEE
jgi:hypothetical protein